ncbi:MAG: PorT family protein [Bacteroidales bacterium]|jgi:hypothetical protein|nr:PorT family protein [Bacteroidales bacterium]
MRKAALFVLCLIGVMTVVAQQTETKKEKKKPASDAPILFKDRIVLDFFSSTWLGLEGNIKQKAINFGFNGAILFDLPIKKNSPFSFGLGVGVTNHNLHSNALWSIGQDYTTVATPVADGIKYRKNKISFTNINIPLEFRYRHSRSGFKISAGVRVGVIANVHTKYFGNDPDGSDNQYRIKDYKIPNKTKIPVEFTFKTGWKFISLNASYMITKFFEEEKGPRINPISFGITLCPY